MTGVRDSVVFSSVELQRYAVALLTGGGFSQRHAEQTADVLVWANARGVDSHGVLRIPRYVEMVQTGAISPTAEPVVVERNAALSVLEASNAPGATAMVAAMQEAVEQASRFGVGWCSARNITHAGAIGYYALNAAAKGFVGIAMTASGPLMAYHGSRGSAVSTNPLAIAVPSKQDPIVLDMSTANVALGKVMAAKDAEQAIPPDWGMDEEGLPTTDPRKVATLTPLGGPKGAGLSLMMEILVSVLVNNPVIAPALNRNTRAAKMNGLAIAVQINAIDKTDRFTQNVADLMLALKAVPLAAGTASILMPGERGFAEASSRRTHGIPLASGTVGRLTKLAEKLDINPPVHDAVNYR